MIRRSWVPTPLGTVFDEFFFVLSCMEICQITWMKHVSWKTRMRPSSIAISGSVQTRGEPQTGYLRHWLASVLTCAVYSYSSTHSEFLKLVMSNFSWSRKPAPSKPYMHYIRSFGLGPVILVGAVISSCLHWSLPKDGFPTKAWATKLLTVVKSRYQQKQRSNCSL